MSAAASLAEVLPPEALAQEDADGDLGWATEGAEALVHPRSTEEVAETLRWACANGVGVLPVASGERLRGGRPEGRFVVLTTRRLAGLEIYEPADVTLTAKAGTRLSDVNEALAAHRQWLPFDPPALPARSLGGLVATGESGPIGTGYGELRNHVLGATVACGDGRVLRLGGRVVKNVAGFDLLRPVVGSRGRLGVVTSICLRAFPVPAVDRVLVLTSDALGGLAEVARAVRTAPVLPASSVAWTPSDPLGARAALVVRLHGSQATVDAEQAMLERHAGVTFDVSGDGARLVEEVRDHASAGDVTLRLSLLPAKLFEGLARVRDRLGTVTVCADAYAGTARVAPTSAQPDALRALQRDIEGLGGALAVEIGGGRAEPEDVGSRPSAEEVELAARLERVFDPSGVMWPCRA